jgi:hypothetical protein
MESTLITNNFNDDENSCYFIRDSAPCHHLYCGTPLYMGRTIAQELRTPLPEIVNSAHRGGCGPTAPSCIVRSARNEGAPSLSACRIPLRVQEML